MFAKLEPVRLITLINAAIGATLVALAFALDWSGDAVAVMTGAFSAWLLVAGEVMRSLVTPNEKVLAVKPEGDLG